METGLVAGAGEWEADEESKRAVVLYLQCGSLAKVALSLGTTVYELQKLAKSQWWTDELGRLRRIEQAELDNRLSAILGKSLDMLVERMEYGEEVYDKEGNMHMRPVPAATLCKIANTVFEKRQLIRGLPTAVTNESSKLAELAEKLEKLGQAHNAKTIEMDD